MAISASTHSGSAVSAFPDVCKTPGDKSPPVPIPYPNIATHTQTGTSIKTPVKTGVTHLTSAHNMAAAAVSPAMKDPAVAKQMEAQKLRSELQSVHSQLMGLSGSNPNQWHQLLDRYVVLTSQVYISLAGG